MNERQLKEIAWALLYARLFKHGANGHNALLIMADLATEAGYELEVSIDAVAKEADGHNCAWVTGCRFVLSKAGAPVLELDDLISDA